MNKIPKKLFQTWGTLSPPAFIDESISKWRSLNPEYNYALYDDTMCRKLIKKGFDRDTLECYDRLHPQVFKADLWRYCVLYRFGGVYADIDTIPLMPIDDFIDGGDDMLLCIDLNKSPKDGTHNIWNAFIAIAPEHELMEQAIEIVKSRVLDRTPFVSRIDVTGPGVLGRAYNRLLGREEDASVENEFGRKQTSGGQANLLKLNSDDGLVVDSRNLSLLQNKHGNPEFSRMYDREKKKIGSRKWTSGRIFDDSPLYKIRTRPFLQKMRTILSALKN